MFYVFSLKFSLVELIELSKFSLYHANQPSKSNFRAVSCKCPRNLVGCSCALTWSVDLIIFVNNAMRQAHGFVSLIRAQKLYSTDDEVLRHAQIMPDGKKYWKQANFYFYFFSSDNGEKHPVGARHP